MSMSAVRLTPEFREEELLADTICAVDRRRAPRRVGMASPVPATGASLARERAGRRPYVTILGAGGTASSPTGAASCSTAPDRAASTSSSCRAARSTARANRQSRQRRRLRATDDALSRLRSLSLSLLCGPQGDLFRLEHSGARWSEGRLHQRGRGSAANVMPGARSRSSQNRCLFAFDRARQRFTLESVHPGHTVEEVIANTGFDFDRPSGPDTPAPSAATLAILREVVAPQIARSIRNSPQRVRIAQRQRVERAHGETSMPISG